MKVLRTPEERFQNLRGYDFAPHYVDIDGLRMHYLDEGLKDGPAVLLLHGEPTWSYLYRKMIPPLVDAGFRVFAPDLIGFGKSDKPTRVEDYSYQAHMDWLGAWLDQLQLQNLSLFCQDWGSLLGLRLAAEQPQRFARIFVANGFLPTGDQPAPGIFKLWQAFAVHTPVFPVGRIVNAGCVRKLSKAEIAAYNAPFPDASYKAGARAFPKLVPTTPTDPATPANRKAWEALGRWDKPFLCVYGKNDPVLGKVDRLLINHVPGAQGQAHDRIRGGHFVQEDQGAELARRLIAFAQPAA
nr:haloalkane dehalogenase [Oceanococcus sp. HetDA_MAG_MS8]